MAAVNRFTLRGKVEAARDSGVPATREGALGATAPHGLMTKRVGVALRYPWDGGVVKWAQGPGGAQRPSVECGGTGGRARTPDIHWSC
jgi:hypothetical protein